MSEYLENLLRLAKKKTTYPASRLESLATAPNWLAYVQALEEMSDEVKGSWSSLKIKYVEAAREALEGE